MKDLHFEKSEIVIIFLALAVTLSAGFLVFGPSEAIGQTPTEVVQS
jgi:hypothetical protein